MDYFHKSTLMRSGFNISHFQFANDIIIFLEPGTDSALNVRLLLHCFELLSSLSINYGKSYVYPVGLENSIASNMTNIMC